MLKIFILVALVAPVAAVHATTLEFELTGIYYVKNKERKINVESLNKSLKKAGVAGLPEELVVNENASAYGNLLLKRIEAAKAAMNIDYRFVIDNGYMYELPKVCYRGEAADVPKILYAMQGTFLNKEQGLLAFRYGKKKITDDKRFRSETILTKAYGGPETDMWLEYDEDSDNVLVMSDLGPQGDGTELYATMIKPCK